MRLWHEEDGRCAGRQSPFHGGPTRSQRGAGCRERPGAIGSSRSGQDLAAFSNEGEGCRGRDICARYIGFMPSDVPVPAEARRFPANRVLGACRGFCTGLVMVTKWANTFPPVRPGRARKRGIGQEAVGSDRRGLQEGSYDAVRGPVGIGERMRTDSAAFADCSGLSCSFSGRSAPATAAVASRG
jgi:hypothetical protein